VVERIVDRIVEVPKLIEVEKIVEKIVEVPVDRIVERSFETIVERPQLVEVASTHDLNRIRELEQKLEELEQINEKLGQLALGINSPLPPPGSADAAPSNGNGSNGHSSNGSSITADDLTVIEGIGPAIAKVFEAAGITTLRQLAASNPTALRKILHQAGPQYDSHDPDTWPEQAELAAAGKWSDLKTLTDELHGGRRP
jgi:predicted flap endonuclease-1-like 5' DNA nuclease